MKTTLSMLFLWVFSFSFSQVNWMTMEQALTAQKTNPKKILIDFYADWCLPCLEIDRKTFQNPTVEKELRNIVPIKIDCTLESDSCTEAVNRFQVVGWPTILFLDKNQNLQKDLSVVQYLVIVKANCFQNIDVILSKVIKI